MIQDFSELFRVCAGTAIIFLTLFLFYRKHILHLFDPLLYFIIAQSFSIELGFLIIDDPSYLINFLVCQLFFLLGFFGFVGTSLKKEELIKISGKKIGLLKIPALRKEIMEHKYILK